MCRKEGSSEIMMIKKQQSKEDCNESSEESEILYVLTGKQQAVIF